MAKPGRTIFQPDTVTAFLIKNFTLHTNGTISDIVNASMHSFFIPRNKELSTEVKQLLYKVEDGNEITTGEMQGTLSRCVGILKNYPITDYNSIEQIMFHFRNGVNNAMRYDYPLIVDDHTDAELHRLNEIIKTLDRSFVLGSHELGERTRYIFKHWDELCCYSEIYTYIATIINLENVYMKLDAYDTIAMIKGLDDAIYRTPATRITDKYPTNLTTLEKIHGIKYEINVYLTDTGYVALTGDHDFNMPDDVRSYYHDLSVTMCDYKEKNTEHLEKYYNELIRLEQRGRKLFTDLARRRNHGE